jgi:hypothetical protein
MNFHIIYKAMRGPVREFLSLHLLRVESEIENLCKRNHMYSHGAFEKSIAGLGLLLRSLFPRTHNCQRRHWATRHSWVDSAHVRPPCVVAPVSNPTRNIQHQLKHFLRSISGSDFLFLLKKLQWSKVYSIALNSNEDVRRFPRWP